MEGLPGWVSTAIPCVSVAGSAGVVLCVVWAKAGPARSVRTEAVQSRDEERMVASLDLISNR
jgi:hypothetical protein